MSWNESDFLERLGPHLQHAREARFEGCPDAAVLCALVDNPERGSSEGPVMEHIRRCSACSTLYTQLQRFGRTGTPQDAPEWENAEKRLDLWMTSFLRAQMPPASVRPQAQSRQAPDPGRVMLRISLTQWLIGTALGVGGVVAVVIVLNLWPESSAAPDRPLRGLGLAPGTPVSAPATSAPPTLSTDVGRAATPTFTEGESLDDVERAMGKPSQVIPDPKDKETVVLVYTTASGTVRLSFHHDKLVNVR
jgi:hypothetical protein